MVEGLNKSEEFACRICRRTFLSLWSYANPQGKDPGKELCDILVVCDPHVIIISVKDIALKGDPESQAAGQRWQRKAIDQSLRQIAGAERFLEKATRVVRHDSSPGLPLPPADRRVTHRVAIALGSGGIVPIVSGDLGKGYVHILTEESLALVLGEVDTISDFVDYLSAKERLTASTNVVVIGGEANLLAFYLLQGRLFPNDTDSLVITDDMWRGYTSRPEVVNKRQADKDSYAWDRLIELLSEGVLQDSREFGIELTQSEGVLRDMARENRFARRQLGSAFKEFFARPDLRSRIVRSTSDVLYVFLRTEHCGDRRPTLGELTGRCFIAKGMIQDSRLVIGIAVDTDQQDRTSSFILCRLEKGDWTPVDQEDFERLQKATGAFTSLSPEHTHFEEYPESE